MTRIAVLTPDPADPSYRGQWPGVLERLTRALAAADVQIDPTPWTEHVQDASGLQPYTLILPVLVWGYHRAHPQWLTACETWRAADLPLANPASVLGWNSDKRYLARLAKRGVPLPATRWVDHATPEAVANAFAETGAEQLVLKPTVSGGAWRTLRLSPGQAMDDPPEGPAMIQPYLPSIETEGETSLLFFGGRFSHAVNKRPVGGDFRIQVQFGGQYAPVQPDAAALALADRVLSSIDEPLLYARIDMARDGDAWTLMEAELIEPDFYLGHDPSAGASFARAVRERLDA